MVRIFPEALWHVCIISSRGPQGYKVVRYNAFRYLDLKEGSDGAHLIASVKPFQTLTGFRWFLKTVVSLCFRRKLPQHWKG